MACADRPSYVRWFGDFGLDDVPRVGGKNASLGEMVRSLGAAGVRVPGGFAITAEGYLHTLDEGGAWPALRQLLDGLDVQDLADLARRARAARELVLGLALPADLVEQIRAAHARLHEQYGESATWAVRSSATAEDLPGASFAGQHETYLHVHGERALLEAVRRCYASLFLDRAIAYRAEHGFGHDRVLQSVGVMKMVEADRACSGVIFTLDPESGHRDVIFVSASWGLGENVVQGVVDPDEYVVHKPTYVQGRRAVLRRKLGGKELRMVHLRSRALDATRNVPTSRAERARWCLADAEVLELAGAAIAIEDHYGRHAGHPMPMDIEWAKDAVDGRLYVLQARPETVASQRPAGQLETYRLQARGTVVARGRAIGTRIAGGPVRLVHDAADLARLKPGDVLVADTTSPDWSTVMKLASAIVTNRGGRTCHAAIVAREMGIPAVVGCDDATVALADGADVTVCCAEGEMGSVYEGRLPFDVERTELTALPRPRTRLMVNLGDPDSAFQVARLPVDGVGLARMEFIVAEHVKVHPMALLHPERVADPEDRRRIAALTQGRPRAADHFVDRLAEGIGTIAAAFWPRPVIVRLSDFKSNEYALLLGGRAFEPVEENPMLGLRGASRYDHPSYAEAFALECEALLRVRQHMGLANLKVMVPFCRRVAEGERVIAALARHGLVRGADGLEVYVMCEIPNNVLLIDDFCRLFDGISIGSNDLTQLTLGVDRDSGIVAFDFDERDEGVQRLIRMAVEGARRNGRHSGICGQAPSDYPEMVAALVAMGIDSISVTPDRFLAVLRQLGAVEAGVAAD